MARFALATGLRESNVRMLRWSQVGLSRAIAWFDPDETKPGRALSVKLNDDATAVLRRRQGDHEIYVFVRTDKQGRKAPVWSCSTKAWYKAVERAGLTGLRWHDLRHTWASWHVQAGTPITHLQEMGGWASYSMVLRYAHLGQSHTAAYANNSASIVPGEWRDSLLL
jgi:integrase